MKNHLATRDRVVCLAIGVSLGVAASCCPRDAASPPLTIPDGHYERAAEFDDGMPHADLELDIDHEDLVVSYEDDDGRVSLVFHRTKKEIE